jgi:autotransporter-associated beta strand protein
MTPRTHQTLASLIGLTCWIGLLAILLSSPAAAATREWRGTAGDGLWSNPNNWILNTVPVDGDDLVFPQTVAGPDALTNDLPNLLVRSMTFTSGRTINGNGIRLQAGVTAQGAPPFIVTLAIPIQLTAAQAFTASGDEIDLRTTAAGTIDLNGFALTLNPFSNASTFADAGMTLNGVISGAGEVIKEGSGGVLMTGVNTYTGRTRLNTSELRVGPSSLGVSDGTSANGTIVANGALLRIPAGVFPPEALDLSGMLTTVGTAEFTGPITLTGTAGLGASALETLIVSGVISGPGTLRGSADCTVTLRNTNTYTGGTVFMPLSMTQTFQLRLEAHEALPLTDLTIPARNGITIDKHRQTVGSVTGGSFDLVSGATPAERGTLILTCANGASCNAGVSGDGLIRSIGAGYQIVDAPNVATTGFAVADHGTLEFNERFLGGIEVGADGRLVLRGTANTTGALTVNGGTVVHSVASTETQGLSLTNATWQSVAQTNAISRFVVVNGGVTLGNSTLSLTLPAGFTLPLNSDHILIDKAQAGAVTGTFAGLPEGGEFTVGLYTFRITYTGGDGNDVLLRVTDISREYLLSEGATGTFFTTDILIANPNNAEVDARVEFFPTGGAPISMDVTVAALSRQTIRVNDVAGLEGAEFSTQVRSLAGAPLLVERTMSWDATGYGAHTDHAAEALSQKWYFAEGSQGFFQTYLLLANPQAAANSATVRYLKDGGVTVERTYDLTPQSRRTIDISTDADLVGTNFGMEVTFTQPGMAERAMYFGTTPFFSGGHESAGVTQTSQSWFVAEGATGPFFETFILVANPGPTAVDAILTFLPQGGLPVQTTVTVPIGGRETVNIEQVSPALANAAVATQVDATGPIVVERAQYWPDPASTWYEAHNSFGVTALGTRWGLAEGRVGMDREYQTYILLANAGTTDASVTISFLREGQPSVQKVFNVAAQQRLNVPVGPGTDVPELQNERFGALIVSTQPIAVERAMYSNASGQVFAAGTSATAVPVPVP